MREIFTFLFAFFSLTFYAQDFAKGYCIKVNNDTVHCNFKTSKDLFLLGDKKIKIINLKGEEITFRPNELKSFSLKNEKGTEFNYISTPANKYNNFLLAEINGRISLYKSYSRNMNGIIEKSLFCKNGIISSRESNFYNFRNWFGKFIEDYPELYGKWMDSDKYFKKNQFIEVIKLYNEHFKN